MADVQWLETPDEQACFVHGFCLKAGGYKCCETCGNNYKQANLSNENGLNRVAWKKRQKNEVVRYIAREVNGVFYDTFSYNCLDRIQEFCFRSGVVLVPDRSDYFNDHAS